MKFYCQQKECKHLAKKRRLYCTPCLNKNLRNAKSATEQLDLMFKNIYSFPLTNLLKEPNIFNIIKDVAIHEMSGDIYKIPIKLNFNEET